MNALVHNDWMITEPQISMFDNRLEILSHGGLPSGMTKKQFFEGISKPRNVTLMRIFLSMGLTEHTGHGIPTIVKKYGDINSEKYKTFLISDSVRVYNHNLKPHRCLCRYSLAGECLHPG